MTCTKSKEKENKVFNFTTHCPVLDTENSQLFKASEVLESLGNTPGLTANDFYERLLLEKIPVEDHASLALAAVAIETMITIDLSPDEGSEVTVH